VEIASVLNSLAGLSLNTSPLAGDFGADWSYTDPGFSMDDAGDGIEPFIEVRKRSRERERSPGCCPHLCCPQIVIEAAQIYLRYLRQNKKLSESPRAIIPTPTTVTFLASEINWYDLFGGSCSERTIRACKFFPFPLPLALLSLLPCSDESSYAVIWALSSMHPKIRGKHLRSWAHILQVSPSPCVEPPHTTLLHCCLPVPP
jgi:hypothetical protein